VSGPFGNRNAWSYVGSSSGAGLEPVRRIEVFTGEGRRRKWALADKMALVAEMVATDNISELARRHGLRPSKLSGNPRRGGAVDPPGQAVVRDYSSWPSLVSEDGS
jgi:hypothetical protein